MNDAYDVGQVCLSGHGINGYTRDRPEYSLGHCEECGEKTITECPECKNPIRGQHLHALEDSYQPANYCHKCGEPFPWVSNTILAAIELSVEDGGLSGDDAKEFEAEIGDIVRETPRSALAAARVKRLLGKMTPYIAKGMRRVLYDAMSEGVRDLVFPA